MGDVVFGNKYGGDHVAGDKIVHAPPAPAPRPVRRRVVLLMSANSDRRPLRLDVERREINEVVARAHAGHLLEVRTADAVRLGDLQNTLIANEPAIAHFSGHGDASAGIVLTDDLSRRDLGDRRPGDDGRPRPVPPAALTELFGIVRNGLRCVVLNACYSADQARAIAVHVPCVIGMRGGIADDAAICFSTGFYLGVAHGETIGSAFRLGCNRLSLQGHADAGVPQLIAGPGAADRPVIARPAFGTG
jgi:hypothetical protein